MNATKISHTVLLENPDSAHLTDSAGVAATRFRAAATEMPRRPMTEPGTGSRIRPTMMAENRAK